MGIPNKMNVNERTNPSRSDRKNSRVNGEERKKKKEGKSPGGEEGRKSVNTTVLYGCTQNPPGKKRGCLIGIHWNYNTQYTTVERPGEYTTLVFNYCTIT